jgi:mono/diheme cytochrome c family protein
MLKKRSRILLASVVVLLVLVALVGLGAWYYLFRQVPDTYTSDEDQFKYGSIGTEDQDGVPYWIWLVLPRVFPEKLPGPGGYTSLGLTWEEGKETPVGFTKKTIGFERVGLTCAACHSATYRQDPRDKPTIVPGGPSSKFDVQAYLRFLQNCAGDSRFNADTLMQEIDYNHRFSLIEGLLYRYVLIPQTKKALLEQKKEFAWMDSRPRWGPGRIDPFNPVKFRVLGMQVDETIGNSDMMSIWNRQAHAGQALHWDGLESSLVETIRTGAIGDGATKQSLNISGLERVEKYITNLPPPTCPFTIDHDLAGKGQQVFQQQCNACHGPGGQRTGQIIPLTEPGLGTDRHRIEMWTEEAATRYNHFADGYSWGFRQLRKVIPEGYQAVLLDGVWLRAPYLHNGSVPTLKDLLTAPANRPTKFYRGYDVLDQQDGGFVSNGPDAARLGFEYDISLPGNSNQGHTYGTDLPEDQKKALIEFLKTL